MRKTKYNLIKNWTGSYVSGKVRNYASVQANGFIAGNESNMPPDDTGLKQEDMLKIQKRLHYFALNSNDVFEILSQDGTTKYISEACERVTGFKPEECIGRKVFDFFEGTELHKMKKLFKLVLSSVYTENRDVVMFKNKQGKEVYLELSMKNMLYDKEIEGIAANFRNISDNIELLKRMEYISTHDDLTGLPNKVLFVDQVRLMCHIAQKNGGRFAVIIMEVEGLRYINDVLGYNIGDQLIIQICERIRRHLSESDFLCRYTGDRFGIIVRGFDTASEYERYAGKIAELFSHVFFVEEYELNVNVFMGISLYDKDEQNAERLICHAESALFRNKDEGRSFKFYSPEISSFNYKQFRLRNDLRKTVRKNQLRVFYQPIVNLVTNHIIAAEALIRWEHPEWGMVPVKEFIPLAEESGFIISMGNWVLREVCRNYRQWIDDGLPAIKMSVNISGIQFFENNFVESVMDILDEFDLDPHFLILEITESIFINNKKKVASDIKRLQSYGIQVALDDFGTGFSSLAYINSLNIDIIKIDGSFIRDIDTDETSAIITRHIVNMAKELNIKLVVEKIENREQLNYLREIKCNAGQGYIFSRPVPEKDFIDLLHKWECGTAVSVLKQAL